METRAHATLKQLTAAHLLREGYLAVAMEVRCPASRYRVDVAGWLDRTPWPREETERGEATLWSTVPRTKRNGTGRRSRDRRCEPRTVIIECKQSRGDFIRDDQRADELIALREELRGWKRHIEEHRIKNVEPELRESGTALFGELESWNFSASRLSSYRKLLKRIRTVERQLYGQTKFFRIAQYRLADELFICVPRGLIRKREAPPGWGMIEWPREAVRWRRPAEGDHDAEPDPASVAPRLVRFKHAPLSRPDVRERLLRNIAIAATRTALRSD